MGQMSSQAIHGVWWTPSDPASKSPGLLTWDPPHRPRLSLVGSNHPPISSDTIPMMLGDVGRHGYMTLLGCTSTGSTLGLTYEPSFSVAQALTRVHLDDPMDPFIRRIEMEVPALALLLGPDPLAFKRRPTSRAKELHISLDKRKAKWRSDGIDIEAHYDWLADHSRLGMDVQMRPQIYLSSARSWPLSYWWDEWLVPLNDFLQVASGWRFRPKSIRCWTKKHISRMERSKDGLELWSSGVDPNESVEFDHRQRPHPLITIDQLQAAQLHNVIGLAQQFAASQEVFLSLLASVLTDIDRPLRNRYLDVISAIEAFDSRKNGRGPVDPGVFKVARKSAIAAVGDPVARKFIRRWLMNRADYSLEDRLRRLQKATGNPTWSVSATDMAKLRNDIAHGNAHPNGDRLRNAYDQAIQAARRSALIEMGL